MNDLTHIKEELILMIVNNFCNSKQCNGTDSLTIKKYYSNANLKTAILDLLYNDKINIIAAEHDINHHIIRNGFVSLDKQIEYIQQHGIEGDFCLYPSKNYLKPHYEEHNLVAQYPFLKLLKTGMPHNKILFFEWGILFKYYSDPRYVFHFSDYFGSISSSEHIKEDNQIKLQTFGVGKNKEGNHVVAAYLKDLAKMASNCQIEWFSMLENNQEECKVLKNYLDNTNDCWNFNDTVFNSILKEISNINTLTNAIWGSTLFRKDYSNNKPVDFDMLYLPTRKIYYDFISQFEKIVVHNLNAKFFEVIDIQLTDSNNNLRTLECLKKWITVVNTKLVNDIHSPLSLLRKERQKPAHEIFEDEYDLNYFDEQNKLANNVFNALNLLRRLIQTHPKASDIELPYKNTEKYLII